MSGWHGCSAPKSMFWLCQSHSDATCGGQSGAGATDISFGDASDDDCCVEGIVRFGGVLMSVALPEVRSSV
jgi:hypothetical protein